MNMRVLRRLAAIAVVATVIGALVGVAPASADTPERLVGLAAGRALDISLPNLADNSRINLSFGDATGVVKSTADPVAKAAGQILPSLVGATSATTGSGTVQDPAAPQTEKCGLPQLPDPIGQTLQLGVACSTSVASVVNGLSSANSTGKVTSLGVNASGLLSQLPLPIDPQATINDLTAEAKAALAPITGPLAEATGVSVDETLDTVTSILDSVLEAKAVDVTLGQATSSVTTDLSKLTSVATADAATIKLLPLDVVGVGEDLPLATIKIAPSKATATYDRGTGTATPDFTAALVTIDLLPSVLDALGLPANLSHIELAPGQTHTILEGTPLQSTITIANGTKQVLPDGTAKATADGVSLKLLQGLGASSLSAMDGGVVLQLSHSEAEVAGAPAVATPQVLAQTALPRTGGTPWIPMAGIGILAVALVGRRAMTVRTVRD
jgi:hypothetical protein